MSQTPPSELAREHQRFCVQEFCQGGGFSRSSLTPNKLWNRKQITRTQETELKTPKYSWNKKRPLSHCQAGKQAPPEDKSAGLMFGAYGRRAPIFSYYVSYGWWDMAGVSCDSFCKQRALPCDHLLPCNMSWYLKRFRGWIVVLVLH